MVRQINGFRRGSEVLIERRARKAKAALMPRDQRPFRPKRGHLWVIQRSDGMRAQITISYCRPFRCTDAPRSLRWCVGIRRALLQGLLRQLGCRFYRADPEGKPGILPSWIVR